ncbi:MAG: hypothetical protein N2316_09280 [Spirochaetes bacterium]|nr:hypothetical protein [Spirochaetota bacterium]
MNIRSSAIATFGAGIFVFVTFGAMMLIGGNPRPAVYPNEHRYSAAISWFERAESVRDVFSALGHPHTEEGMRIRKAMDVINIIDFAFMISYAAFFGLLYYFFALYAKKGGTFLRTLNVFGFIGAIFAIVMLFGDIFENIQLLELTKATSEAEVDIHVLGRLMFFTRVKWFAIFFASIGFSFLCAIAALENPFWYMLAFTYAVSGLLGFLSFFIPAFGVGLEISGILVGMGWMISTAHAGYVAIKSRKE